MQSLFTILICVLQLTVAHGQIISEKTAGEILQEAWRSLQKSDSVSFVKLWGPDNSPAKRMTMDNFHFLRQFLDTALARNLHISYTETEEHNLKGTDTKYWIKAWFKYTKNDYTGFGFYVAYKNDKWIVQGKPSTSRMKRD